MESLALLVSLIALTVLVSGPLSLFFNYCNRPFVSGLAALFAICAGVFWLVHVSTSARYLGLAEVAMGLYVLWRTAEKI